MFTREFRKNRACASKLVLAIIGITAGMLCGLFGVGALLAAYVSRVTETNSSFKANISAVFIVDNTFRVLSIRIEKKVNYFYEVTTSD